MLVVFETVRTILRVLFCIHFIIDTFRTISRYILFILIVSLYIYYRQNFFSFISSRTFTITSQIIPIYRVLFILNENYIFCIMFTRFFFVFIKQLQTFRFFVRLLPNLIHVVIFRHSVCTIDNHFSFIIISDIDCHSRRTTIYALCKSTNVICVPAFTEQVLTNPFCVQLKLLICLLYKLLLLTYLYIRTLFDKLTSYFITSILIVFACRFNTSLTLLTLFVYHNVVSFVSV